MTIKKLVSEAASQNPIGVKEVFAEMMQERIRAALEEKVSELQELSNKTLGKYIQKATRSRMELEKTRDDNREQAKKVSFHDHELIKAIGDGPEAYKIRAARQAADDATRAHLDKQDKKLYNKTWNREKGVYTAIKKLGDK